MPTALNLLKQLDKNGLESALDFIYDKVSKRFRGKSSGRFLSQNQSLSLLDGSIQKNRDKLQNLAIGLTSGKIDLVRFVVDSSQAIKDLHILNATKALSGRADNISTQQLKILSDRVKEQLTGKKDPLTGDRFGFKYLIRDLARGQLSEAQLTQRLNLYANSAELTQNHIIKEQKVENGYKEAFRQLASADRACKECVKHSSLGWISLEDLVMPGEQCSCRANCRCTLIYR